jgi:hypothetical protein
MRLLLDIGPTGEIYDDGAYSDPDLEDIGDSLTDPGD